jgi:hypothetical protein
MPKWECLNFCVAPNLRQIALRKEKIIVRTLDSFNPNERLLKVLNHYGVTTVQTAPGPRNPIAGRAGI